MNTVYVKPNDGMKVRMPEKPQELLPEDGAEVPRNAFWIRRIADGSVAVAEPPKKKSSKTGNKE